MRVNIEINTDADIRRLDAWIDGPRVPSWSVIVDGAVVYTGGYGRAKREADKRGGTIRPSETMIRVAV